MEKAIGAGQPIAGSLFWKWAIPVFQKQDPRGPYGVMVDDTTMAYVKEHAQFMKRRLNGVPPVRSAARGAGCQAPAAAPRAHTPPPAARPLTPPPAPSPRAQRPECGLGAWFGAFNTDTEERSCVDRADAAKAYYALGNSTNAAAVAGFADEDVKLAQALRAKSTLVFATRAACCKPGTGAHEQGCTVQE